MEIRLFLGNASHLYLAARFHSRRCTLFSPFLATIISLFSQLYAAYLDYRNYSCVMPHIYYLLYAIRLFDDFAIS